jgi:CheY-like chemotaxis protein
MARDEDRQHSAESGIDLHLTKPVDPERLNAMLDCFARN